MNTENNKETTTDTAVNADVGQEVPCWKIDVRNQDGQQWQLWWKGESRHRVAAGLLKTMNMYKVNGTLKGVEISDAECLLKGVDACIHFLLHSQKELIAKNPGLAVALKRSADAWITGSPHKEAAMTLMKQVDNGKFLVMKKVVRKATEAAEVIDWTADIAKRMEPKAMFFYVESAYRDIFPVEEFHRLRGLLALPRERSPMIYQIMRAVGRSPMRANIYLMLMGV
jgi:hypothetical protein